MLKIDIFDYLCVLTVTNGTTFNMTSCLNCGEEGTNFNTPHRRTHLFAFRHAQNVCQESHVEEKLKGTGLRQPHMFLLLIAQQLLVGVDRTHQNSTAQMLEDAPVKGVASDASNLLTKSEEERGDVDGRVARNMDDGRDLLPTLRFFFDRNFTPSLYIAKRQKDKELKKDKELRGEWQRRDPKHANPIHGT